MKKPLFNKVAVVGVGLIGGSLALAIKKHKLAKLVVGVSHRRQTIFDALERQAVDVGTLDLKKGVEGADLVILCGPVSVILKQIKVLKPYCSSKTILMDVGSSKRTIQTAAKKSLKGLSFVGCHPMAGSEKQGILNAKADLFQNALCFMTTKNKKVEQFWKALGARPILINAKAHDAWVARASYLPHMLSFSLFQKKGIGKFSGTKLKAVNPSISELARLAGSDDKLWADILLSNNETLTTLLDFEKNLYAFKKILRSRKVQALQKFIQEANHLSNQLTRVTGRRPDGKH